MKPCINESTTMKANFETDVKAYSKAGFKAIELWLDKVYEFKKKNGLSAAKTLLEENSLDAVCACVTFGGPPKLMLSKNKNGAQAIAQFKRHLNTCKELGVPLLVVPTDFPETVVYSSYDLAVENLREVGEIAQSYNMSIAVEFIRGAKLVGSLSTAIFLVKKVNRPNIGVLFDFFHFYTGVSKLADMDQLSKEILFFVHGNNAKDLPREIVSDGDRVLLCEGIFPITQILTKLKEIGYDGHISLELFSEKLWGQDPYNVAKLAYENLTKSLQLYI